MSTIKVRIMVWTFCAILLPRINDLLLLAIRVILADRLHTRLDFVMRRAMPLLRWMAIFRTRRNFFLNWSNIGWKDTRWCMVSGKNEKRGIWYAVFFTRHFTVFFEGYPILCHSTQAISRSWIVKCSM